MNKHLLTIIFLISVFSLFGQEKENLFPEITIQDLQKNIFDIDSTADAIILAESGMTKFVIHQDFIVNQHNRRVRKQILTKSGKDYGNIVINFYRAKDLKDYFIDFKATVYSLEDGKIETSTIDKKDLIDEQVNDYWACKKYAFPNLKEGSIIEYEYEVLSERNFALNPWYFQHDVPTLVSKFELSVCPFYNYVVLTTGYYKYDYDTVISQPFGFKFRGQNYETRDYSWLVYNVPAFKDIPYITTEEDYKMKAEFQIESYRDLNGFKTSKMKTWDEFVNDHVENRDPKTVFLKSKKLEINRIIEELNIASLPKDQKIEKIYKYVQQNYLWNGYVGKYPDQTMRQFITKKAGSAQEINLFLLACLRAAEIEAYPILLSTRSNGKIFPEYPINSKFNYLALIVSEDEGSFLLDATDPETPQGHLPFRCGNGFAVRLKKAFDADDVLFFNLDNQKPDNANIQSIMQFDFDNEVLNITMKEQYTGYKAMQYRDKLKEDGEENFFKWHFSDKALTYKQSKVKNLNENEEILSTTTVLTSPINNLGDRILVDFMPYNPYTENPFKKDERKYPINFGKKLDQSFTTTIQIPEGYEVEFVPENFTYVNEDKTLIFKFVSMNNGPFVQIRGVLSRANSIYVASQYHDLKKFYDEIIKKYAEKIVLKKKEQ